MLKAGVPVRLAVIFALCTVIDGLVILPWHGTSIVYFVAVISAGEHLRSVVSTLTFPLATQFNLETQPLIRIAAILEHSLKIVLKIDLVI